MTGPTVRHLEQLKSAARYLLHAPDLVGCGADKDGRAKLSQEAILIGQAVDKRERAHRADCCFTGNIVSGHIVAHKP